MRILVVSRTPTHPIIAGNRKFILEQVELLNQMGHELFFLYIAEYCNKGNGKDGFHQMRDYWCNRFLFYRESFIDAIIRKIKYWCRHQTGGFYKCDDYYPLWLHKHINMLNKQYNFDACLINYFFLSKLLPNVDIKKKGLITHDYFAYKSLLMNNKHVNFNITANEEAKAMQRSPHIFALNDGEAEYFKRLSPKSVIHTIYCSFTFHHQKRCDNHKILLLSGSNEYNKNGLDWFLNEVFPIIVNKVSDVRLVLGGAICEILDNNYHQPNIEMVGHVDDVSDFYKKGDVAINPTYQGTGIKIKTIESIAYDKVTLVHPHSTNGVYKKNEIPVFSSLDAEDWANFLVRIWTNPSEIDNIKKLNEEYISQLNKHIIREYNNFLLE